MPIKAIHRTLWAEGWMCWKWKPGKGPNQTIKSSALLFVRYFLMFPHQPKLHRRRSSGWGLRFLLCYVHKPHHTSPQTKILKYPLPKHIRVTEMQASWVGQAGFGLSLPLRWHANKQTHTQTDWQRGSESTAAVFTSAVRAKGLCNTCTRISGAYRNLSGIN